MISKLLVASLAVGAYAAPVEQSTGTKVSFTPSRGQFKRANGELDMGALLRSLNGTLAKYNAPQRLPTYDISQIQRRAVGTDPLTDQVDSGYDLLYYGPGNIRDQTFLIDFDTGSADFFVPGLTCGAAQGCKTGTQYDQKGTDRMSTTQVTYGTGAIMGENYLDTVTVAGLTAPNTNVISLTEAQGFNTSDSNSLMGMGFSTIANSKSPTFFENLMSQGKVNANEFSFYLGRAASGTAGASEMTLGGRNTAKYTGAVTSVPVTRKGYWQVAIDGATVNGGPNVPTTGGQAAIDTGTTIVLGPTAAVTGIFAQVPGSFPVPLASGNPLITIFAYPCNQTPQINLIFAKKQFAINKKDFSLGVLTPTAVELLGNSALTTQFDSLATKLGLTYCAAAVGAADLSPTMPLYIVGDTFLKNWYSIYNYNGNASVSFAAAANNQ